MAALKLFISHSSRLRDSEAADPQAKANWQLLQDTCAALPKIYGDKIEVLVDYQELHAGDEWELRLHTLLNECDAAMIHFSRRAVDESDWVKIETTILVSRARCDPEFKLVPVLLADQATPENMTRGYFGALGILHWQRIENVASAQQIVAAIVDILGDPTTMPGGRKTAFQKLLAEVDRLLADNLDGETLANLWTALCPGKTARMAHRDRAKRYARVLAEHLLGDGAQSLVFFQDLLTQLLPRRFPRERAQEMLKCLRALWVEPVPAAFLPAARSDAGKCLALNGNYLAQPLPEASPRDEQDHFTLRRYLERAWSGAAVHRIIPVVNQQKPTPETTREMIQRQIREYYRRGIGQPTNDDIDRRIRQEKRQVVVFLPAADWSAGDQDVPLFQALTELKAQYRPLIFIWGINGEMLNDTWPPEILPVLPPLQLATEQDQYLAERDAWDLINH